MNKAITFLLAAFVLLAVCAGCSKAPESTAADTIIPATEQTQSYLPALTAANEAPTGWTQSTTAPEPPPNPWTEEDVAAMAQTLAGECYDDKQADKRLVCEVILNRVSNGYWGDTVITVITAPGQFYGYWKPSRTITDNDREIAEQTLKDWYAGDCAPLSEYLYFESGPNRENIFRAKY